LLVPPASAAAADADIKIIGGNSNASIVCGNVAAAEDLARRKGIPRQRNDCTADSHGGAVDLANVDIYISAGARLANSTNRALADLVAGTAANRVAVDTCKPFRNSATVEAIQRNICVAKGYGGQGNVTGSIIGVVRHPDGTESRRTVAAARLPVVDGAATAECVNVVSKPQDQQDECTSSGAGASLALTGVTVVEHKPDGSSTVRRNIDLTVRGGTASSKTYCFNVVDGAGQVVQVNVCRGAATGGDVTLSNVKVITNG